MKAGGYRRKRKEKHPQNALSHQNMIIYIILNNDLNIII